MSNTYKRWAFEFKPGTINGRREMFVQVWRKDAVFSAIEQGWFCPYAYRFKFPGWKDIPVDLSNAINKAFIVAFNPERKRIGQK